mmetsp:Transcript_48249/g.160887  ORF Transcript_48249/g.160887 Transcript_48249/m.160887 type:complete len:312 (-) Transcript_48249:678-1613(-)
MPRVFNAPRLLRRCLAAGPERVRQQPEVRVDEDEIGELQLKPDAAPAVERSVESAAEPEDADDGGDGHKRLLALRVRVVDLLPAEPLDGACEEAREPKGNARNSAREADGGRVLFVRRLARAAIVREERLGLGAAEGRRCGEEEEGADGEQLWRPKGRAAERSDALVPTGGAHRVGARQPKQEEEGGEAGLRPRRGGLEGEIPAAREASGVQRVVETEQEEQQRHDPKVGCVWGGAAHRSACRESSEKAAGGRLPGRARSPPVAAPFTRSVTSRGISRRSLGESRGVKRRRLGVSPPRQRRGRASPPPARC